MTHLMKVTDSNDETTYVDPARVSMVVVCKEASPRHQVRLLVDGVYAQLTHDEWQTIAPMLIADPDRALAQARQEIERLKEQLRQLRISAHTTNGTQTHAFEMVAHSDVDEAIRRADALSAAQADHAPRVITTQAKPVSMLPASDPRIEYARLVTRVKRTTFYSKTSGGQRPMWSLFSVTGTQVNVFDHADPLRDHKSMLERAGYLSHFQDMKDGDTSSWNNHPIEITVTLLGKFWDIVSFVPRKSEAAPDELTDGLNPEQLAVCREAKDLLERADLVVFDCETTGIDVDDEVVEIAGILLDPGHPAPTFQSFVKPTDMKLLTRPGKKGKSAFDIHGIGEQMLKAAPRMDDPEVLNLLSEYMDKKAWGSFNIEFDARLLRQGLDAVGDKSGFPESRGLYCIQRLMNRYIGHEYVSLDEACKALGIERSTRHRAAADASDTLEVLKALAAKAP